MRGRKVGRAAEDLLEARDGLRRLTEVSLGQPEVVLRLHVLGRHGERRGKLRHGLRGAALLTEHEAEIAVREEVPRGHGERVLEERPTIAPIGRLDASLGDARADGEHGGSSEDDLAMGHALEQVPCAPADDHEQADQGQIRVMIGHRLSADPHDADDRNEGAEVPEPAGGDVRPRANEVDRERGDRDEHGGSADHRADVEGFRIGIEARQRHRPERLGRIRDVGRHRVGESLPERSRRERHDQSGPALRDEREGARHGRERQEGELLDDRALHRHGARDAAERPPIEQEQHAGQRDEHRLRHQPERQAQAHRHVRHQTRTPRVAGVGPHGEHPKGPAQDVLPFRDLGDRLHVQRMHAEERGDEGAPPGTVRHRDQRQKQQYGVRRVQDEIRQVMPVRVETEQLVVEHVRPPGERMPVAGVGGRQRPAQACEPLPNVGILAHVLRVVVQDEGVVPDVGEGGERHHDQQRRDDHRAQIR